MLKNVLPSSGNSTSEGLQMVPHNICIYSTFLFEILHNVHLGISKLAKQCKIKPLLSDWLKSSSDKPEFRRETITFMPIDQFQACNLVHEWIGKKYCLPWLHVDFSWMEIENQLGGQFVAGICKNVRKKACMTLDIEFLFLTRLISSRTGWGEGAPLKRFYESCSKRMLSMTTDKGCVKWNW